MFEIDVNEPVEALTKLAPAIPGIEVVPLNERGWADYRWSTLFQTNMIVHVERKTWGELLSGIDKVEDQLRGHLERQPEAKLIFILEGLVVPISSTSNEGTGTLKRTKNSNIFVRSYSSKVKLSQVCAWLYQISKYIEVYQTPDFDTTIQALFHFYKADQKLEEEHKTLQRYYKKSAWHPNPQVAMLMGLFPGKEAGSNFEGVGIGEKRAETLIERFGTVWNVMGASPKEISELPGFGKILSKELLRRIGRPDII